MRGDYTYTVRRTLLIKRQEPLRKYWTDISCFGGKVWISVECCGLADDRNNGDSNKAVRRFWLGKYEVSVKNVFPVCHCNLICPVD